MSANAGSSSSNRTAPSIEQLWLVFAEIEEVEQLVSWRIGSIYLWPLLRGMLMREVAENLGVFERRPAQAAVPDPAGADFSFAPSNYAVVPFVRRNAAGLDPFSDFIVDSLKAHGEKPLILGMGPDGHIASLFPGHAIPATGVSVIAEHNSPKPPPQRLTFTYEAINNSGEIWFVVAGADKAEAVSVAFSDAPTRLPVGRVHAINKTVWFVDEAAAAGI